MRIEKYQDYINMYTPEQRQRHPVLHYTWRKSVMYCLEYSIQNNVKYDVLIKLRPDIIFPANRRLENEINNFRSQPEAFFCDNSSDKTTDDVFWLGSPRTMYILSNFGDPTLELDHNYMFRDFILFNNIKIGQMADNGYAPLRPETIHYNVMTQFSECFYYDHFWYSNGEPLAWTTA